MGKIRLYEYPTQVAIATLEDRDGVNLARDLCPDEAEDFDGYLDGDGCPDRDNDADGIYDTKDLCPNKSEDQDGINDIDGCSESETAQIFKNQIVLSHDRLFETHDENELSHAARFLLKGVIDWWQENGKMVPIKKLLLSCTKCI